MIVSPNEPSKEQTPPPPGNVPPLPEIKNDPNGKKDIASNHKRSKLLTIFTILLLGIAIGLFCLWFFYFRFYESTDDAYANGNMININSAVSSSVIAFYADNTDLVTEGQLLALLDKTNYELEYNKQLSALAATVLQVRQIYDNVKVNSAKRDSKRVKMGKAQYDYDNRSKLIGSLAISNEDFTHSKDDLSIAEFEFKQAEAELKAALDAAGTTPYESHPILEQQKTRVREAYCNLQHCAIYAPYTGYVALRSVDVGEWVQPTTPLMCVIPKDYVWVDANFKETQLSYMRVGQPATVTLDIYGSDVVYKGKVLGIASGTGSVFSLIPPQNATGNWIKIVQRLPVRISLDPEITDQFPVRLGLSAYATVDITDTSLPMLVQTTAKNPIATTKVFDIDLTEINRIIDKVVGGA